LQVTICAPGQDGYPVLPLKDTVPTDVQFGAVISEMDSGSVTVGSIHGTVIRYELTKQELTGVVRTLVHSARLTGPAGLVVTVEGKAAAGSATIEPDFRRLLNSVEVH
jgi:hypothetical protein